ncbi:HNH endonuclease signature motif containing protein [Mycobacterium sp. OTB74]|jgi:hypothetical protein|uniref:HNH endonuclease signature motif containing protein n=1 Tax=Mycobacterium sp. OTB74 TaxID=1853452 RepID=UPI00247507E9|nr:HNH endonuclease signature motif containing protein [Mycobacterium sp. OTB74]MDH6242932.1 hypothetical protein [Mycobacterium sp. OTB74]
MAGSSPTTIFAALDALDAAIDAVNGLALNALGCGELLAVLSRLERAARRAPIAGQAITARLGREATPGELGGLSLPQALAQRLLVSVAEARRRIGDAAVLAPRVGLTGEPLAPVFVQTAAAQARGEVGADQVAIVRGVMDKVPHATAPDVVASAEAQMAEYAGQFRPEALRKLGARLLAQLNPDGDFDEKDRARRRGFRIGPQQVDGMSQVNGWITPELRAMLEPGLHKLGAPGIANPDDDQPCISGTPTEAQIHADGRSGAQRNHDALLAICRSVLSSGELGQHHGLPVTVIVSTTLQELHAAAGHGVTSGGTLLPMRDLIRLVSSAYHYLCIFDKATEKPLNLFRTKRCASDSQRVALQAIHRGCTFPDCTAPAYLTEVHHLDEYAAGGNTNIDDMTLACRPHHKLVKPGGWHTRRGPGGRTEWIPPPELDVGQARSNDFHHPERLLGKAD